MTPSSDMPEKVSDLVARLRKAADLAGIILTDPPRPTKAKTLLDEAAALIDTLQRERDERNEWAAMWHDVVETLATVHGLGILDYNEVIPAFGRYVDAIKAERHELRAEVTRLREAAQNLVAKLRAVHDDPAYRAVWELNQVRTGIPYRGMTYIAELDALSNALSKDTP